MNKHPSVMIIDDNRALAENIQEILEDQDIHVEVAEGGLAALEKLEDGGFNLVITDVRMPGMDGIQTLKEIHARWPGLPVILMTAFSSDASLEEGAASGALGVISKPVDIEQLIDMVWRVAELNAPVLLVEDDRALRINLTEALLEITNVVPYTAPSIAMAERLVREIDFRVAIIDVRLPDGDGLQYGQELQKRLGSGLQIFYITGYAAEMSQELTRLRTLMPMSLLEKPFAPARLLEMIQSIV